MLSGIMRVRVTVIMLLSVFSCSGVQPQSSNEPQPIASPIVTVQFHPNGKGEASSGSGVLIRPDGHILTHSHLLKDSKESNIQVFLINGSSFPARIVGDDPKTDLAVLKIEGSDFPYFRWARSVTAGVGDPVIIVNSRGRIAKGTITKLGASPGVADYEESIEIHGTFRNADFGGALLNVNGELLGINSAYHRDQEGTGWAIPSDLAHVISDSLIKFGTVRRAWMGVGIQVVTPDLAKVFHVKEYEGVLVSDVIEYGPASKAGIKRGDVILEIDGQPISNFITYRNIIASKAIGSTVKLKIIRDGRPEFVPVQILLRPDVNPRR